jgi:hypothetical protein
LFRTLHTQLDARICPRFDGVVCGRFSHFTFISKDRGKDFRYYSSLAKSSHIWRDNSTKFFIKWLKLFGARSARAHAMKLAPAVISGRWNSTGAIEARLLGCFDEFVAVAKDIRRNQIGCPVMFVYVCTHGTLLGPANP